MEQTTQKKYVLTEEQRDRKNKQAREKTILNQSKGISPIKRQQVLIKEQRIRRNEKVREKRISDRANGIPPIKRKRKNHPPGF